MSQSGGEYRWHCREEHIESYYANLESSSFESEDGCVDEPNVDNDDESEAE